jgi:hypothetical protein
MGCLVWIGIFALAAVLTWLEGPRRSVGPLGDSRPCAPLIEHCLDISRGRASKRTNHATAEECKKISRLPPDVCGP